MELSATKIQDHFGRPLLARAKIKCGEIISGASVYIEKAPSRSAKMRLTLTNSSQPKSCGPTGKPHPYKPCTDSLYLARLALEDGQVIATNLDVPLTAEEVLSALQRGRLVGYVTWGEDALQACPTCTAPVVSVSETCACL